MNRSIAQVLAIAGAAVLSTPSGAQTVLRGCDFFNFSSWHLSTEVIHSTAE